ncbi:hypothetical protein Agub_g4953 [Astrephomene gubernaculifera]|uniref:Uncharacterized protein n=1 Tax=Astrephomene gubernaculifera TaxID=47775 RepID=A0AAD3DN63_9CHLO|nr:hypothetical protein Agub_g4953 [Astrephomene gubernaculifera]
MPKLGLLAVSAGISALVVALVLPYTEPEALAALARHPVGGIARNATAAAFQGLLRLLEASSAAASNSGPSLRDYYPIPEASQAKQASREASNPSLTSAQRGGSSSSGRRAAAKHADADLDWADPEVWRLQQEQVTRPYYTEEEVRRLLYWCSNAADTSAHRPSGSGSSGSKNNGDKNNGNEGSHLATSFPNGSVPTTAAAEVRKDGEEQDDMERFRRLTKWVTAAGGEASRVTLGSDERGVRGLHASQAIPAGEVALAVPLRLGLSAATFRAARMLGAATGAAWAGVEDADLFLDALAVSYEVAVHGERSPWAQHLCLMPRTYGGLPVHASDPRVSALLSHLPSVRRLAAKRRAQLAMVSERLARPAMLELPGGRAALARLARAGGGDGGGDGGSSRNSSGDGSGRDLWLPLWHWSYAAAKTRAVTLAAEELRAGGGGGSGEAAGAGVLGFLLTPPPPVVVGWAQVVGSGYPAGAVRWGVHGRVHWRL